MRAIHYFAMGLLLLVFSATSFAQVVVSITVAPPALPVYEQPICPGDGYLWTPGYWAYDYDYNDYYWVPGTWVMAPEPGLLWTPPYWGWNGSAFAFYNGYWGPQVGFYGGVVYGFGYFGVGFQGGHWQDGNFFYNRAVSNVDVTVVRNVYNTTVVNETVVNRVSYNGGEGGLTARPTPAEEAAARERHVPPVAAQTEHIQQARSNPQLRASSNQGRPPIAATARPGEFKGNGVVEAREAGAPYHAPAGHAAAEEHGTGASAAKPVHPNDLPPLQAPAAAADNSKAAQKYQQQQQKLYAKQQQDRQKLQQKQDQEHQRLAQQNASDAKKQQVEQKHQQQTQQMEQRHEAQQQQLSAKGHR